jgi:von Willebrand factor type A domain
MLADRGRGRPALCRWSLEDRRRLAPAVKVQPLTREPLPSRPSPGAERARKRVCPRLLAVFLGALVLAVPASAQAGVKIANVDVSVVPSIRLTVVTSTPSSRPPTVTENGGPVVDLTTQNLGAAKNVVLAIDHSHSMRGRPLADALAAARRFVALKPRADQIAVVSFATQTFLESGFSTSTSDAASALDSIAVDPVYGTRLYDAIVQSARALRAPAGQGASCS